MKAVNLFREESRLTLALLICVAAILAALVTTYVRYGAPWDPEEPRFEIALGRPSELTAEPGEPLDVLYHICNRSGEPGTALMFGSWVSVGDVVQTESDAQGTAVSNVQVQEGCHDVSVERAAPMVAGEWRRIGIVIVVFGDTSPIIDALASRPVLVDVFAIDSMTLEVR